MSAVKGVPKAGLPKTPGVAAPSVSIPKSDPTTTGIGNTLTNNGLANDTFSSAQAHTPGSVRVASAPLEAARAQAREKLAGLMGMAAKVVPAITKAPSLARAAVAKAAPKATAVARGLAPTAASGAISTAADAAGRQL